MSINDDKSNCVSIDDLKVDPQFRNLCPAPPDERLRGLKVDIIRNGETSLGAVDRMRRLTVHHRDRLGIEPATLEAVGAILVAHIVDIDRFVALLREHNRQWNKSFDEKLREEIVSTDPNEAYVALIQSTAINNREKYYGSRK